MIDTSKKVMLDAVDLSIEVTRRCNLECDHCLRGCAQDVDMSFDTFKQIASKLNYIEHIAFTGGEPLLRPEFITDAMLYLKQVNKFPSTFWLKSNGQIYDNMYDGVRNCIEEISEMMYDTGFEENCVFEFSQDTYHDDVTNNAKKLSAIYRNVEFDAYVERKPNNTIDMGFAHENCIGGFEKTINDRAFTMNINVNDAIERKDYDPDVYCFENYGVYYFNVYGDLITDCDLSYDWQDLYKVVNVFDPDFDKKCIEHFNEYNKRNNYEF